MPSCSGTSTGILDETTGRIERDLRLDGMLNEGVGPEKLMAGAGVVGNTGGTGRAPAIIRLLSCNQEYACISK